MSTFFTKSRLLITPLSFHPSFRTFNSFSRARSSAWRDHNLLTYGNTSKTGSEGEALVQKVLTENGCKCMRAQLLGEGTKADIAVWCEKEGPESAIGVQVKTCSSDWFTDKNGRVLHRCSFFPVHRYPGMPVVCLSLESKTCWLLSGDELAQSPHGKLDLYFGSGTKRSEYRIPLHDVGGKLCGHMQDGLYTRKHADVWGVPVSVNHQVERDALKKITPFLQHCGISITFPAVHGTPVDHLWSCEWIDNLRVQQKMARPSARQAGYIVDTHRHMRTDETNKRRKVKTPYAPGDFDLLWVAPPIRVSEQHLSNFSLFCDTHLLGDKGVLVGPKTKGKICTYVYYPAQSASGRNTRQQVRRSFGWTTDHVLDTSEANWGCSAERLLEMIRTFAVSSGSCKK
eukprot:GDKI01028980.1.p1 GENE.GDKI01028980.1~~GDKI01028980.1.p1  ORF type:complete len:399 (-),score=34.71 GDKI01028980.1:86-1282(-)